MFLYNINIFFNVCIYCKIQFKESFFKGSNCIEVDIVLFYYFLYFLV